MSASLVHVHLVSKITVVLCDPAVCCLLALVRTGGGQGEGGQRNVAYVLFLSVLAAAYTTAAVHQRLTTCFLQGFCALWVVDWQVWIFFFQRFHRRFFPADFARLSIGHLRTTTSRLWLRVNESTLNIADPTIVPGMCLPMSIHWQTFFHLFDIVCVL